MAPETTASSGIVGWAAQSRSVRAPSPGFYGWVAGISENLRLTIVLPATQLASDTHVPLTLEVSYEGAVQQTLRYLPTGLYSLRVPPAALVTLAITSPRYQPVTRVVEAVPGQVTALTLLLEFQPGALSPAAGKTRRRYRRA